MNRTTKCPTHVSAKLLHSHAVYYTVLDIMYTVTLLKFAQQSQAFIVMLCLSVVSVYSSVTHLAWFLLWGRNVLHYYFIFILFFRNLKQKHSMIQLWNSPRGKPELKKGKLAHHMSVCTPMWNITLKCNINYS